MTGPMSQIQILTSKITQVCQDICDIKLRQLSITQSDKKTSDITSEILTNQSDCKDTWDSNKNGSGTLSRHDDCAEDGNNYIYRTPNHPKHGNWENPQHYDTYQPQLWPEPSEMPPMPLPYSDPSEASERSSSPLTSPSFLMKKDDIEPNAPLVYMERPTDLRSLCLAPAKKNGRAKLEEELEMREGTGLMRGVASPDQEFGGGTGIREAQPDWSGSETKCPSTAKVSAL